MAPKGRGGGSPTSAHEDLISKIKSDLAMKKTIAEASQLKFKQSLVLKNNTKGNKFLVIKNTQHDTGVTMAGVSPFLIEKSITGTAGSEVEQIKLLRDGTILVETKNVYQAQKLIKLIGLPNSISVTVSEHERLNSSKGVIMCKTIANCTEEEILSNLSSQGVTHIHTIKRNGIPTGTFFLTFATTILPNEVKIAYLNVKVTHYIPDPARCFTCLQYGHISKNCKSEQRLCINCAKPHHTIDEEKCNNAPSCIHCPNSDTKHNSISRDCPKYKDEKNIQKIRVTENISIYEAAKKYRLISPTTTGERTYASHLRAKTCNCPCACNKPQPSTTNQSTSLPNQSPSMSNITTATVNQETATLEKRSGAVKHPMSSSSTSEKIPYKLTKTKAAGSGEISDDSDISMSS